MPLHTGQVAPDETPPPPEVVAWAARQVHVAGRVVAMERLRGGISAAMDRITVTSPSGRSEVVLRRWPDEPWTDGLVAREAAALRAVGGHGVPTPLLLAQDDGTETGVRCTLTTALPGHLDLAPADPSAWLVQLAAAQAAVHAVPATDEVRRYGWSRDTATAPSPDRYGTRDRPLTWLQDRGLREAARDAASGPLEAEEVLVHGDYQHFNVLWSGGALTGVVDWPHAGVGNRGSDVGHCRLNLAVLFGSTTAADYLAAYQGAAGLGVDRRADLRALLCFDLEWQEFIPRQVLGRAQLDRPGMPGRVTDTVRRALDTWDRSTWR